jgi:hypothetical protein
MSEAMRPRGNTDAYGQEERPSWAVRGERQREFAREKCASGQVFQRERAMTIPELDLEVRALVPKDTTTFIGFEIKRYDFLPHSEPEVVVSVWTARNGFKGMTVEAGTCEQAFDLFKANVLPALGLTEERPAAERLAEMGV